MTINQQTSQIIADVLFSHREGNRVRELTAQVDALQAENRRLTGVIAKLVSGGAEETLT